MKNNMKTLLITVLGCVAALSASAVKINVTYKGAFNVLVTEDDGKTAITNGTVTAVLDNFGPEIIHPEETFDLSKKNPFIVTGKLETPGFLRIRLDSNDIPGFKKLHNMNGFYCDSVPFNEGRILPARKCPDDFMIFWKDAIAKYNREITAQPDFKLDESLSDASWDVWRLTLDVPGGRKLHCFLTKQKNAVQEKRLPARVQIAAAGYGGWSQQPVKIPGHITLMITVYPFEPDVKLGKKADYDAGDAAAKEKWGVPRYCMGGISESREAYFFYPVILGANRAIDWLAARDDVDPMRLTYQGTSQGGGLGLAVTALNGNIRRSAIFVPALTGLYGIDAGYDSGWPKLIENHPDDAKDAVRENAVYFDGASFAKYIKVPIRIAHGLADTTCPPTAVRSAYNVINSYYKDITPVSGMNHSCNGEVYNEFSKWLDDVPDTERVWPEGKTPDFRPYQNIPEIEWYAPTGTPVRACIIVAPGGGYEGLAYNHEGLRTARNFLDLGLHVVILRYRCPHGSSDYSDIDAMCKTAWMDAQRTVRIVRSQAKKRGFDPNKIGMTGFSAGGHLTCKTATCSLTPAYEPVDELDETPCNLNFAAPVYPAYLLTYPGNTWKDGRGAEVDNPLYGDMKIDDKTPPMCFIHGDIDCHSAMGSVKLYTELRRKKIPAEMHIYSWVHHGFGGSVRHKGTQSGWEILVRNFLSANRMAPYYDAYRW